MEKEKTTALLTPPVVKLTQLKNLFLQLNHKTNEHENKIFYTEKNKEEFLLLDKIKENLAFFKNNKINSVYLMGDDPLKHPDFNQILRLCLKITNTTVITSGTMINDKKARFLRKIDNESDFETIYRINLDCTDELENDQYRGRGSFRKALCAIFSLIKYEFNPIICTTNRQNRSREEIFRDFQEFFNKKGIKIDEINLKILPCFDKINKNFEIKDFNAEYLDCSSSRILSNMGIYSCPMLVNDYRARLGSSVNDYSKINYLDCEKCSICTNWQKHVEVNDWL